MQHVFKLGWTSVCGSSVNLAVRIHMYLDYEIDICMYSPKNTVQNLHFFNVRICKYVSIRMYRMYMHVYVCICMYVCICIYCMYMHVLDG
jgi:hypothetical protein